MSASGKCGFPIGTVTVNAIGSLLIGVLMAALPQGGWMLLLVTGFCGGFTTFSAFSAEALALLRNGEYGMGALYVFGSIAVCILFRVAGNGRRRKIFQITAALMPEEYALNLYYNINH